MKTRTIDPVTVKTHAAAGVVQLVYENDAVHLPLSHQHYWLFCAGLGNATTYNRESDWAALVVGLAASRIWDNGKEPT